MGAQEAWHGPWQDTDDDTPLQLGTHAEMGQEPASEPELLPSRLSPTISTVSLWKAPHPGPSRSRLCLDSGIGTRPSLYLVPFVLNIKDPILLPKIKQTWKIHNTASGI